MNDGQDSRVEADQPKLDAALALALLVFGQHLERGVFEVEHTAEVERQDLGFLRDDEGPDLLPDACGISEENAPLHPYQQQTRKGLIFRMLPADGPENVCSRFAPQPVDPAASAAW